MHGFVNLNKEKGMTSQSAVSRFKRILKEQGLSFSKIGHLGTLDPDGEGVLPIALGRATRLFDYFLEKKKVYYTEFLFGETTDTLDAGGEVLERRACCVQKKDILAVLPALTGAVEQMPPAYSAKSVDGVRAYKLARQGETPVLRPKRIQIYQIDLLEHLAENKFSFRITCSGGTYIRSLARDMAEKLNTVGLMSYICREESGGFLLAESRTLDALKNMDVRAALVPLASVAAALFPTRVDVPNERGTHLLNGVPLTLPNLPNGCFRIYLNEKLIGIGEKNDENRLYIKVRLAE